MSSYWLLLVSMAITLRCNWDLSGPICGNTFVDWKQIFKVLTTIKVSLLEENVMDGEFSGPECTFKTAAKTKVSRMKT